jgi:predicted amino acid-binding ACT domain protein
MISADIVEQGSSPAIGKVRPLFQPSFSVYVNPYTSVYDVTPDGKKFVMINRGVQEAAAAEAGLSASSIPTLLVEGDDKPGLGFAIAQTIAEAGVNMTFFVAQAMERKFSAVLGFETEADAKTAAPLIKKATASKKK